MSKNKINEENLVVQSNSLIEATYNMTANEIKIFEACVSQVDSRMTLEKDRVFTIDIKEAQSIFNNDKNAYTQLKTVSERLFRREVKIRLDENRYVLTHFLDWVEYDEQNYILKIKFAEKIVPYISQLEDHFTQYRRKYTINLSSIYSHRIYQLLVCWAGQGKNFMEVEIDALRSTIADGKYPLNANFKVRVLDIALAEINKYTDFYLEVLLLKKRKTFERIQFKFGRKQGIAKEEEKRKIEVKEKTERNAVAKKARLQKDHVEATKHDNKKILEEYHKHPEGTIFSDAKGKKYFKTSSGILMGEDGGAILEQDAAVLIKKGVLAGAFS